MKNLAAEVLPPSNITSTGKEKDGLASRSNEGSSVYVLKSLYSLAQTLQTGVRYQKYTYSVAETVLYLELQEYCGTLLQSQQPHLLETLLLDPDESLEPIFEAVVLLECCCASKKGSCGELRQFVWWPAWNVLEAGISPCVSSPTDESSDYSCHPG